MRTSIFSVFSIILLYFCGFIYCQGSIPNDDPLRGPQNALPMGVIDGVVLKDEVPVRSRVEYEHVRLADYVWSKRLFSRIDSREKVNHPLFYPFDAFNQDFYRFPKSLMDLDTNRNWIRHQDRYSLWTIIERHAILGDLTIYRVYSEENPLVEDGYQLKYPEKCNLLNLKTNERFFKDPSYRQKVAKHFSIGSKPVIWYIPNVNNPNDPVGKALTKGCKTFQRWVDSLTDAGPKSLVDLNDNASDPETVWNILKVICADPDKKLELEEAWNNATIDNPLYKAVPPYYIDSRSIVAFNIKEDWFFDKERSMLDKRIIAIAPVAKIKKEVEDPKLGPQEDDRFSQTLLVNRDGDLIGMTKDPQNPNGPPKFDIFVPGANEFVVEKELFWLYFPELRNVMVNYYVYNNQSDAQWMSFDDFFWKRLFSAQIYKATDQFDRDIEDYRYGVDALYEAQKIKETMRTWETDLWHY